MFVIISTREIFNKLLFEISQLENASSSCRPPVAERAEPNAVICLRAPGAQPQAAAGDGEEAAGEGANHQGSEGAG